MFDSAIWILILAVVLFVTGPLLGKLKAVPPILAFLLWALGGALGLAASILGVAHGFGGDRTAYYGLVGLLPTLIIALFLRTGFKVPRINDIATDHDPAPDFAESRPYPAAFVAKARAGYPDLAPKEVSIPPQQAYARAMEAIKNLSRWQVTRADPAALRIEGTVTSGAFGFVDDFVVLVQPRGTDSALVRMRSRSRVGQGDFGANAAHVRQLLARI